MGTLVEKAASANAAAEASALTKTALAVAGIFMDDPRERRIQLRSFVMLAPGYFSVVTHG
jgi:hypothetical protein